jgi:hypothetical protein
MELRVAPARGLRTREAEKRRSWLAAAALALALVPSALGSPPRPPAARVPEALPEPDPTRLALAPSDLVAEALAVGFDPVFEDAGPAPAVSSPPPEPPPLLGPELALAASVHEPSALWLAALSVASLAFASRGMRRSPRSRLRR